MCDKNLGCDKNSATVNELGFGSAIFRAMALSNPS